MAEAEKSDRKPVKYVEENAECPKCMIHDRDGRLFYQHQGTLAHFLACDHDQCSYKEKRATDVGYIVGALGTIATLAAALVGLSR